MMATAEHERATNAAGHALASFPFPHSHFPLHIWLVPLAFILAALAALPLDLPAARWSIDESPFRALNGLFYVGEMFGHGVFVGLLGLTIYVLDPAHRRAIPRVLASAWGAGLAANLGKMLVVRMRPNYWLDDAYAVGDSVLDTFVGWLPLGHSESVLQSFPSGHTATAVGLALALSWLYPRGRWLFAFFALLVALQRVVVDAHFLSDVCTGAAVGWIVGQLCLRGPIAKWGFDRWESSRKPAIAHGN